MSHSTENVVSTKEITEHEIRHKETVVITESSHTSQSQVTVQDINVGIVTGDNASDKSVSQLGEERDPIISSCQVVNADQQVEPLESPTKRDSKETQTEITESQYVANTEEIRSDSDATVTGENDTGEVLTNGYHDDEMISDNISEEILQNGKENSTDAEEITKSVDISDEICDQLQTANMTNSSSPTHTEQNVVAEIEAKEEISSRTNPVICSATSEITDTLIYSTSTGTINTAVCSTLTETTNKAVCSASTGITNTAVCSTSTDTVNSISDSYKEPRDPQENGVNINHHSVLTQSDNLPDSNTTVEIAAAEIENSLQVQSVNEVHLESNIAPQVLKLDKIKTKVRDVPLMNGFHATEIKEENLKSQLKEIISEIDLQVKKEEESENAYYHTWHPKGEYTIEKTDIEYNEIVPVKLPDILMEEQKEQVKEPLKKPKPKSHPVKLEKPIEMERKHSGGSNCSTPIEIPEGVPLLARMLPKEGENDGRDKIPLERLFTQASDSYELDMKKKKMYSSSSFYRSDHPTIEDQVHLAHKISCSLIDGNNKESKGQSMYMKRKTKSPKWSHTGHESGFPEGNWQPSESDLLAPRESKEPPALKLLLNPKGIHDYNSIQNEEYNESTTMTLSQYQLSGIGVGREIATDLQSPTGKGAALFAKRKKRMDKFIVDETNVQKALVNTHKHEPTSVSSTVSTVRENSHSAAAIFNGTTSINNTPSFPAGSRNLPNLSTILTQQKSAATKSILSTSSTSSKGKTLKRSNTVSFPSLDRGFSQRTPTPATRERRGQIKSWGSQKTAGISIDTAVGGRQQAQKRFSHIELNSTPKHFSPDGRPVDYGKKQKTNTVYTAEVKVEEKAAMTPQIMLDFNGVDPSQYLDIAMDNQEKRRSFNLAAKGWGTYHNFYTPLHLSTAS